MSLLDKESLRRLGAGESIAALCRDLGIDRAEFDRRWQRTIEAECHGLAATVSAAVAAAVEIQRDRWGIPHIFAQKRPRLVFRPRLRDGPGPAVSARLSAAQGAGAAGGSAGEGGLESDMVAEDGWTQSHRRGEWERLAPEVKSVLEAFAAGVNCVIERSRGQLLPIEFDLLDYRPEPWSPMDSLAIESEFRWYLTGRFPVIVMPGTGEAGARRRAALPRVPAGRGGRRERSCRPGRIRPRRRLVGRASRSARPSATPTERRAATTGSSPARAPPTGKPLVASDPHIAFDAVSCWYEAHLRGGVVQRRGHGLRRHAGHHVRPQRAGRLGHHQQHLLAARPLPGADRPGASRLLPVRRPLGAGARAGRRSSRSGAASRCARRSASRATARSWTKSCRRRPEQTGPVSLQWLGAEQGGWLTALLAMNRAGPSPNSARPCGPGTCRRSASSSPTSTATSASSPPAASRSATSPSAAIGPAGTRRTSGRG